MNTQLLKNENTAYKRHTQSIQRAYTQFLKLHRVKTEHHVNRYTSAAAIAVSVLSTYSPLHEREQYFSLGTDVLYRR